MRFNVFYTSNYTYKFVSKLCAEELKFYILVTAEHHISLAEHHNILGEHHNSLAEHHNILAEVKDIDHNSYSVQNLQWQR